MSRGEVEVFYAAQATLKRAQYEGWHVFPQVGIGEIIGTTSDWERLADRAFQSVNSKRCDLLIADRTGLPVAVVEYQGSGHYEGTAEQRDRIKRIAVERAGIRFIEIPEGAKRDHITRSIMAVL